MILFYKHVKITNCGIVKANIIAEVLILYKFVKETVRNHFKGLCDISKVHANLWRDTVKDLENTYSDILLNSSICRHLLVPSLQTCGF